MCVTFSRLMLDIIMFISVAIIGLMLYGHLTGSGSSFVCSRDECKVITPNPFGGSMAQQCFSIYFREVCFEIGDMTQISLQHHRPRSSRYWFIGSHPNLAFSSMPGERLAMLSKQTRRIPRSTSKSFKSFRHRSERRLAFAIPKPFANASE